MQRIAFNLSLMIIMTRYTSIRFMLIHIEFDQQTQFNLNLHSKQTINNPMNFPSKKGNPVYLLPENDKTYSLKSITLILRVGRSRNFANSHPQVRLQSLRLRTSPAPIRNQHPISFCGHTYGAQKQPNTPIKCDDSHKSHISSYAS